jgi:curved DNA-binding protein CbpA
MRVPGRSHRTIVAGPLDPPFDPYKILQVDPEADPEIIQAAFRRLVLKYHPDVAAGPEASTKMAAINAAWKILRDPASRAAHDRDREQRAARSPARYPQPSATWSESPSRPPGSGEEEGFGTARAAGHGGGGGAGTSAGSSASGGGQAAPGPAGPPPGRPSGSVLTFGRYAGWSLGEIARRDLEYIEWLDRMAIGRTYREELDRILRESGRRRASNVEATERRGLFRRR